MAAYTGKDVAKLKNKGGKWKYMSEADMIKIAKPFAPKPSIAMTTPSYFTETQGRR